MIMGQNHSKNHKCAIIVINEECETIHILSDSPPRGLMLSEVI